MSEWHNSPPLEFKPSAYLTPIECPHCGCDARLINCVRFRRAEERTFECETCKRVTYVSVGVPSDDVWGALRPN